MVRNSKTEVLSEDKEAFKEILFFKKDSNLNIMCSFTYITPNYDVIATLKELYDFTKDKKTHVFFVMWDMNTLANPYFKKYCSMEKDHEKFIEDKILEVKGIARAVGFEDKNFSIYKSSDMWKRLVSYSNENLFQQFFSVLARLPVKDFSDFRKCSHIFQIAIDILFATFFNKLYKENIEEGIDIIFSDYYKKRLYTSTRQIMIEEGIIKSKPAFLIMETVPYIVYEERTPEWNMRLDEIKYLLMHCSNKDSELIKVLNYINEDTSIEKLNSRQKIVEVLGTELYKYLLKYKKLYQKNLGYIEQPIVNISKSSEAMNFGHLLTSKIFLDILILADGTRTTSEIAKQLKKSIATISTYTRRLREMGYLRTEYKGKLKRNLEGIRISFDSILSK